MSHTALKQEDTSGQQSRESESKQANDLPVGEILRRTRVHYGKSISDVETILRIKAIQIDAIEKGNHEYLPARVYAIGFVRSYARYLGLDENYIVELFKRQSIESAPTPDLNFPVSVEESKVPSWWVVAGSLAVLIAAPIIWFQVKGADEQVLLSDIPPITQEITQNAMIGQPVVETQPANISTEEVVETADMKESPPVVEEETQNVPVAEEVPVKKGVVLSVIEDSWVEIRNAEGKALISRVLRVGEEYFVPDRPGLTMSIGNAVGVELSVDGKQIPPLGPKGSVIRHIPLQADALKNLEKEY